MSDFLESQNCLVSTQGPIFAHTKKKQLKIAKSQKDFHFFPIFPLTFKSNGKFDRRSFCIFLVVWFGVLL